MFIWEDACFLFRGTHAAQRGLTASPSLSLAFIFFVVLCLNFGCELGCTAQSLPTINRSRTPPALSAPVPPALIHPDSRRRWEQSSPSQRCGTDGRGSVPPLCACPPTTPQACCQPRSRVQCGGSASAKRPEGLSHPGSCTRASESIPAIHVPASPLHVSCPALRQGLGCAWRKWGQCMWQQTRDSRA